MCYSWIWFGSWASLICTFGRNITIKDQKYGYCNYCFLEVSFNLFIPNVWIKTITYFSNELYSLCRYITTAVNLKIFPSVVNSIGLHNMFWIHGCLCIFMCVCGMMILPETQGKTLTELSQIYSAKEKKPSV